ncbi:MAG: hypothetical protein QOH89_1027, partial [Pseudonocardiales bacterium]|nr:hypothetical protein [Pseudonocardiales bacterium]
MVELRKLARALDVDEQRLEFLAGVPEADLRELRRQVGEAMFQAGRPSLVRVAALSKAVPVAVAVKLSQAVLPPLIAARTSELLEPHRAADLVSRISPKYLADVSLYMDAARAPEVVAAIPAARVAEVAAELARREEWIVIGSFVAQVGDEALAASVARFDGEQLLRIGFVLDDISRLDDIVGMLSDEQADGLLAAAAEFALWQELTELVVNLEPPRVARLAAHYAALDKPAHAAYSKAAKSGALPKAV